MTSTAHGKLMQDARSLQAAVAELVRIYQVRDRDRICCHDISVTQCHALEVLALRGPMRAQALAEALRLDKSTVTRVVDALVRKAYVERLPDPDDARAQSLRITPAGRALFKRIDDEMTQQQAALLGDLAPEIRRILKPGGVFAVEIGWDQGPQVKALFEAEGFEDVKIVKDLGDRDRVVTNGPDPRTNPIPQE